MLERGQGTIMTIGSGAAYTDPSAPPGEGGVGLAYAVGKAAGHRLVGHVKAEFSGRGIRSFNINPGHVRTERNQLEADLFGRSTAAPTEAIGAVVAWLATAPEARRLDGTNVEAQQLCKERNLYPF
jgi:NAD(P)-dependent dehydrogenase (short-subunit alcohol dehydrogenase family)